MARVSLATTRQWHFLALAARDHWLIWSWSRRCIGQPGSVRNRAVLRQGRSESAKVALRVG
eukprot:4813951-Pyramimonas_sp.AAC.1